MKFSTLFKSLSLLALSLNVISCSSTKNPSDSSTPAGTNQDSESANAAKMFKMETIYFDFDKYVIREDQIAKANSIAEALKSRPNTKVQIQGNTDDRGSVEYNMALGSKRANALQKYLISRGVQADNVSTVSYGKERPAVQGADESAWSKNRRDDVIEQK